MKIYSARKTIFLYLAIMLLLNLSDDTFAQTTTARINGVIKDEAGAAIRGAKVAFRNVDNNFIVETATDTSGLYWASNLLPGTYEMKVDAPGFSTLSQAGIELSVGQQARLDLVLKVLGLKESVDISSEAPVIEPTRTESSYVIDERRIRELPTSTRQFIDFTLLTPTVSIGRAVTGGAQGPLQENVTKISFAGLSEQHSNFFAIDGADHTISLSGFNHLTPSQEAVQEFRIITGTYGAEFGHALGGVVNIITRSGTNSLHGSLYYFGRNDAINARNILSAPGLDALRQHQFGFSAGGPARKDKLFFFGNYEGQRKAQSPIYTQFLLDTLPAVNAVKAFYHLPPESLDVIRGEDYDQFLVRSDYQLNERNRATARYNFVDQRNKNAAGAPGNLGAPSSFRDNPIRDQSLVLTLQSTPGTRLSNQALFQYSHRVFNYTSVSGEPNLQIQNVLTIGRDTGPADAYDESRLELSDSLLYQLGHHSLRVGGDFSHITDSILWPLAVNGLVIFSPESFFGAPPFGQPTPFLFVFSVPRSLTGSFIPRRSTDWRNVLFPAPDYRAAAEIPYSHNTFDTFGQDQWHASNRLAITYGLRYFIETRGRFDIEEDYNNIDPRFGCAYSPSSRSVIRGGFGVYHSVLSWSNSIPGDDSYVGSGKNELSLLLGPTIAEGFKRPEPLGISLSPIPTPEFTAPAAFAFIANGVYPSNIPLLTNVFGHSTRRFPNPYAMQWSLQTDYSLSKDLSVSIGYLGVHALKMMTVRQVNSRVIGKLPNGKIQFAPLDPRFGIYHIEFPGNSSIYHGAFLTVNKRFRSNFAFSASYTFSRAIDLVNSGSNLSFKDAPDDQSNIRSNRGLSNQHVGQRLVMSFLASAPKRTFLRGFNLASIVTLESPRSYTLFAGFDANGDLETGPDRVGAIGRNTFRGDSFGSVDLRLSRAFHLTEKLKASLIAESFNLFNTVNITDINTVYGAPDFIGAVPRKLGDGARAPNPSFGTPAQVANPRQLQLAVRLTW